MQRAIFVKNRNFLIWFNLLTLIHSQINISNFKKTRKLNKFELRYLENEKGNKGKECESDARLRKTIGT